MTTNVFLRRVLAVALAMAASSCNSVGPESDPLAGVDGAELPERMSTGLGMDEDLSGDLRPEARDLILRRLQEASREGVPYSSASQAITTAAFDESQVPASIRVWRRGLDGSTSSCTGRVDVIPFEKYVKGVLGHEWIVSWHSESLKAGAVAIRSYAAWWVNSGGKYTCADLDDTTASQVYKDEFFTASNNAVDATASTFVLRSGALVFAEYSAENSDPTADGISDPVCAGTTRYGHGRGTCQWGSQRWANGGKTYTWILTHYYPGSTITKVGAGQRGLRGDVNGDGRADLVSLKSDGSAYYWPGQSGGTFTSAIGSFAGTMNPALFDKNGHYVVDVADVDGNGTADLVTVSTDGNAYVYAGSGSGFCCGVSSFAGTLQLRDVTGTGHEPVAVADVNGDGRADLVTVHTNGNVYVYPGTSSRSFGTGVASFNGSFNSALYDKDGHYVVGVADVTGDGKADLVTVHTNGNAYVYPGTSTGAFGSGVASFAGTLVVALAGGVGHEPVDVADVTGDGRADLVTVHTNGNAYVYPGTSSGAFGSGVASFSGTFDTSLFDRTGHEVIGALDVTGDGRADLVTTRSGTTYVYPGTSTGAFGSGVDNFAGTLDSSRFDGVGHEFASERIISRRRGCSASGC